MPEIELLKTFIRGIPEPMPRPRARAMPLGNGKFTAQMYQPEKYPRDHANAGQKLPWVIWRDQIKNHIRSIMREPDAPADGPIILKAQFFLPRPGYLMTGKAPRLAIPCIVKPDVDNYVKLLADALTTIWEHKDAAGEVKTTGIWCDDGRVFRWNLSKWYPERGCGITGAHVSVVLQTPEAETPNMFEKSEPELVHPRELLSAGRPPARGDL